MFKDLYTFSKNAWHVKLFKWVYGTDPTQTFHTMCPYWWSSVATILFLPLILFVKMFGKSGTALLKGLESYRRDRRAKFEADFIAMCTKEGMTDKEAYDIYKSKCWDKYNWDLEYEVRNSVREKKFNHERYLREIEREKAMKEAARQEKFRQVKETKLFTYSALVVSVGVIGLVLYTFILFFMSIEYRPIDWEVWATIGKVFGFAIGGSLALIGLFRYILRPFVEWLSCIKMPKCRLCKLGLGRYFAAPFIFLGKGICIIGDMIYMTYKNACPMIKWTDEK